MALCVALSSALADRVSALLSGYRTVALGMLIMVVGLLLFAQQGASASYASLTPGFVLFGVGAGLMTVPLMNTIMESAPAAQAGIASALINASREVAGLLGVTIIGAVLRTVQSSSLRGGATTPHAFLDGYHAGLWVTIGLMAAGVVLSYVTLRPRAVSQSAATEDLAASIGSPLEAERVALSSEG
jgi:MFS family permease